MYTRSQHGEESSIFKINIRTVFSRALHFTNTLQAIHEVVTQAQVHYTPKFLFSYEDRVVARNLRNREQVIKKNDPYTKCAAKFKYRKLCPLINNSKFGL